MPGNSLPRVLVPDAQFDKSDVEEAVFGAGFYLDIHRRTDPLAIPEDSWRRCDGIVMWHEMQLDAAAIARLDRCRIVVRCGVGFDNVDVAACTRRGIPVCNVPNYGTTEVADHAIGLMLALTRGIIGYQARVKADPAHGFRWDPVPLVRRIRGRLFGAVGFGRIGIATVRRARALDMDVTFHDPYVPEGLDLALAVRRVATLGELLESCDVVSLHTPLTAETRGLIGEAELRRMKRGAILINTSRGGVVDLDALHRALHEDWLSGAGLDVLPSEPPDPDHPLIRDWAGDAPWIQGRLVITPHAAFFSPDGHHDLRRLGAETAMLYLRDGLLRNNVNPGFRRASAD